MQRIDENTYIDDTLVTCAEYQLFLDEMREQGKYYQPDHWTSYQFPDGQARKPILGVRQLDAKAFSEWLTQRDNGEWKFHLPAQEEASAFPIKYIEIDPLGYWLSEKEQLIQVGTFPKDTLVLARALDTAFDRNHSVDRALDRAIDRAINRDHAHVLATADFRARDLMRDLERTLNLERDVDLARDLDPAISHQHDFDYAIDRVFDRDRTRVRDSILAINHALDVVRDLPLALNHTHFFVHGRAYKQASKRGSISIAPSDLKPIPVLDSALDRALDIYIGLYTLQERIAGRSPAFEGIRLIKERIK